MYQVGMPPTGLHANSVLIERAIVFHHEIRHNSRAWMHKKQGWFMLFSVVVLSFNSKRTLSKCLSELEKALDAFSEPSEIFVIENGSKDGSLEILESHHKARPELYKVFVLDENTGTTASRNLALRAFSGRYVLILDSDAYINGLVLESLKTYLDQTPSAGLVAPKLRYADGRFQLSTDAFPTLIRKFQRFFGLGKIQASINETALKIGPVDYAISASWLLRADAIKKAGLFDETIFYSPEDVDYCLQVWRAGYEVHYNPSVTMIHDAQELSRGFRITKFHIAHLKGLFYLFSKYGYFFSASGLRERLKRQGQ